MIFGKAKQSVLVLALLLFAYAFFKGALLKQDALFIFTSSPAATEFTSDMIKVYITGAVRHSGWFEVEKGSRLKHLLLEAGGLERTVNLRLIDLNAPVFDGQKIKIPTIKDMPNKVDVNIASKYWLMQVKGIGPVKARRIVEYRNRIGSFLSLADLQKVKGIGPKTVKKIKDQIRIGDGY